MNIYDYLIKEWQTISSAPAIFITGMFIVSGIAFVIARAVYGGIAETARERLAKAKEDIERMKKESTVLNDSIGHHGQEIEKLKTEMSFRPKIHVGPTEPKDKEALWLDTSKLDKAPHEKK